MNTEDERDYAEERYNAQLLREESRERTGNHLKRYASPQAWRRLRAQMTEGELEDIAKDIASAIGEKWLADHIAYALTRTEWSIRKQA